MALVKHWISPDITQLFEWSCFGWSQKKKSTCTIVLIVWLKVWAVSLTVQIKYPENFFLLRGNHECASINRIYGFYDECKRRYNVRVWKSFTDCFNCLPVAALIDEKVGTHLSLHAVLGTMECVTIQVCSRLVHEICLDVALIGWQCHVHQIYSPVVLRTSIWNDWKSWLRQHGPLHWGSWRRWCGCVCVCRFSACMGGCRLSWSRWSKWSGYRAPPTSPMPGSCATSSGLTPPKTSQAGEKTIVGSPTHLARTLWLIFWPNMSWILSVGPIRYKPQPEFAQIDWLEGSCLTLNILCWFKLCLNNNDDFNFVSKYGFCIILLAVLSTMPLFVCIRIKLTKFSQYENGLNQTHVIWRWWKTAMNSLQNGSLSQYSLPLITVESLTTVGPWWVWMIHWCARSRQVIWTSPPLPSLKPSSCVILSGRVPDGSNTKSCWS